MVAASSEPVPKSSAPRASSATNETRRLPPGPPPREGLVTTLRYYAGFALDPLGFVKKRFDAYGDTYYARYPGGGLFVFRHPDHIREVLSTKASSFSKEHTAFAQLSRILGEGLLTSDGDTWTRQRRMIGPAFAPSRIAEYGAVMVEEALATVRTWGEGGTRDINDDMTSLTLRVVSRALFGHDVRESDIRVVSRAMHAFQRSLSSPDFLPAWVPVPSRRRLAEHAAALDALMYRLIRERREAIERGREPSGRKDLLEMLVTAVDTEVNDDRAARARLTVEEVRDQLVTLFLAGHETTAHALSWTFYCLAQHPEVEQGLHRELDEVLEGRAPTVADLERLPMTEQIVSEALRMYPPVYGIARRANEDVTIGEWTVPRGSEVMVWVYFTHHDPRFYPEPAAFRPERFAPQAAAALPKMAWLPFGGGPRACIGKSFAMMEARLLLATLAQRHRLVIAPGQKVVLAPRITLTPKRGMKMIVRARRPDPTPARRSPG
ncbi:MAG: cytochrome P450 [Deltaproteobacteria bacterium]|nr:cytochrome P450 [Deltaproteobacteria bacterium]